MADYIALYDHGPDRPVVTHSANGIAMVYTEYGNLVEAPSLRSFKGVVPAGPKAWKIGGTFGSGAVKEVDAEGTYPWCT